MSSAIPMIHPGMPAEGSRLVWNRLATLAKLQGPEKSSSTPVSRVVVMLCNKALYTNTLKGVHFGTDQYDVPFADMHF